MMRFYHSRCDSGHWTHIFRWRHSLFLVNFFIIRDNFYSFYESIWYRHSFVTVNFISNEVFVWIRWTRGEIVIFDDDFDVFNFVNIPFCDQNNKLMWIMPWADNTSVSVSQPTLWKAAVVVRCCMSAGSLIKLLIANQVISQLSYSIHQTADWFAYFPTTQSNSLYSHVKYCSC